MTTIISSSGQVVLPSVLQEHDHLVAEQTFEIQRLDAGQYILKLQAEPTNAGVVDWLLACPEKGWFQPIPSESTDSL